MRICIFCGSILAWIYYSAEMRRFRKVRTITMINKKLVPMLLVVALVLSFVVVPESVSAAFRGCGR